MVLDYYPFGLKHKGYNSNIVGVDHPYGYLNQEEQNELGLNWLTFRYRNYMPEIGRFFGVDPISEEYMSISTYQFAHNNPIWKIELEGLEGDISPVIPGAVDYINEEPRSVVQRIKATSPQYKPEGQVFSGSATIRGKYASIGLEASLNKTTKAKFNIAVAEGSATVSNKNGISVKGKGKLITGSASIVTPAGESTISASLGEVDITFNEDGVTTNASLITATGKAKTQNGTTVSDGFTLVSSDEDKHMNTNGTSLKTEYGAFSGVLDGDSIGVGLKVGPASVSVSMNKENAGIAISNFFTRLVDAIFNGAENYKFKGVPNQN